MTSHAASQKPVGVSVSKYMPAFETLDVTYGATTRHMSNMRAGHTPIWHKRHVRVLFAMLVEQGRERARGTVLVFRGHGARARLACVSSLILLMSLSFADAVS